MRSRTIAAILLVVTSAFSADMACLAQESLKVDLKVLNAQDTRSPAADVYSVSNIQKIQLEVGFSPPINRSLEDPTHIPVNPASDKPECYLLVRVADTRTGEAMLVKADQFHWAEGDRRDIVQLNLEILEDAPMRRKKIEDYLDALIAKETASGAASPKVVERFTRERKNIIATMDEIIVENRIGSFRVSVEYHSTQRGEAKAAKSPEITVDVLNKGRGTDALPQAK